MYIKLDAVEELYESIQAYDNIIIHRHVRPDPDAVGSQLGLKALIENRFPNKKVLAAGTINSGLSWLGEMDKVTQENYKDSLVIVVDTANQPRIDGKYYDKGKKLIKIDHHIEVDEYGDLQIVQEKASSTAELICQLSIALGERLPMTKEAGELLYAGMVGDTARFLHSNSTEVTFETVAHLKKVGIDNTKINNIMNEMSLEELKFQAFIIDQLQLHQAGAASILITLKDMENYKITEEETNSITNLPGRVRGVISWVIFVEQESTSGESYRVRLRSKGPDINQVAVEFGGGGHAKASGADAGDALNRQALINRLVEVNSDYLANQN